MSIIDLFGKPLGGKPEYTLSLQQKRQAALLYHWMSLDYLKGLKSLIDALIQGADVRLELAKQQGRDEFLVDERWGVRDTAANWSTHAFPALEDFRQSVVKDIALRTVESYQFTGAYQCGYMLNEISSQWMTQEEEDSFKKQWELVYSYAQKIDDVTGKGNGRLLDDDSMVSEWQELAHLFPRLPKFKVRTDVEAETDKLPKRTGVYVAQNDPYATLQFGWTGNADGALSEAMTFNDLGLSLMKAMGRNALWLDGQKMAAFAGPLFKQGVLTDRGGFKVGSENDPQWAGAILGRQSFTQRPCKWYFVELVNGEFEDASDDESERSTTTERIRVQSGQSCPQTGYYLTPAQTNSRRLFKQGEVMPSLGGDYGLTIWQWDEQQ